MTSAQKNHSSESINRGEGEDLLFTEDHGGATLERTVGLEGALRPRRSSVLSPERIGAALGGNRGIAGDMGRVLVGMGIGVCLGVSLCYREGVKTTRLECEGFWLRQDNVRADFGRQRLNYGYILITWSALVILL